MKAYIAGKLWDKKDRNKLEKIDIFCKKLGLSTYLPHKDMGVFKEGNPKPFFERDRDEIDKCDLLIALLDWQGISSGTAWEIGYAYAKKIPVVGLVEDMKTINQKERTCVMCMNSIKLVDSLERLKEEINKLNKK